MGRAEGQGRGSGRRARRRGLCKGGVGRVGRTGRGGVLAAVGAYLVNDLRNPEGLARPVLRRAAQALAASRREVLRKAGASYLKLDAPRATPLERSAVERQTEGGGDSGEIVDAEYVEITEPQGGRR